MRYFQGTTGLQFLSISVQSQNTHFTLHLQGILSQLGVVSWRMSSSIGRAGPTTLVPSPPEQTVSATTCFSNNPPNTSSIKSVCRCLIFLLVCLVRRNASEQHIPAVFFLS
mmetsp:Transcript_43879/g.72254  ORF Transcript_43879/g.72254 Transcript_43879/m.72254 type:complete len:111 (+) Transcript_43879:91-423(+)